MIWAHMPSLPLVSMRKIVHSPKGEEWTKNFVMGTLARKTTVTSLDYGKHNFNQTFQKINKQE